MGHTQSKGGGGILEIYKRKHTDHTTNTNISVHVQLL